MSGENEDIIYYIYERYKRKMSCLLNSNERSDMKNKILMLLCLAISTSMSAQLVNNGGTITIQQGATLYVESDVENNASGTITIMGDGELEVQGDLDNSAGTLTANGDAIIRFTGSDASNVTAGTHSIANIVVGKTGTNVVMLDDMTVGSEVSFESASKLDVGANVLTLESAATVTAAANDRYIIADGGVGGSVSKEKNNTDDFKFEIGDATSYAPVEVTGMSGTTSGTSTIAASTEAIKAPNAPAEATDFINRHWDISAANITDFEATLEGEYADNDIDGAADEAKLSGAGYDDIEWDYTNSTGTAATNLVTVDVDYDNVEFTATNKFGKVDLTVFLEGAFSGTAMTTSLRDQDLIPLTSPYAADPVTVTSLPANLVDWVLVEVRDAAAPSTVLSSSSAFLLSDGSVTSIDGSGAARLKDASGSNIIAIRHRNHLPVRTNVALDVDSPSPFDFSSSTDVYEDSGLTTDNMKTVGGTKVLWGGNANFNDQLQYNGGGLNDRIAMLFEVGFATTSIPTAVGYYDEDVNMDGFVQYNGGGLNDRIMLLFNVGFTTTSIPLLAHL